MSSPRSFWGNYEQSVQKTRFQKTPIFKPSDVVELVKNETAFSFDNWYKVRFYGPMYGISTIGVPIIKGEKFFKKETRQITCIPKQVLGYDYRAGTLDEKKCPYLKYLNLDNSLLGIAVINFLKESNIAGKEKLIHSIENSGLKNSFYNKDVNKIFQANKELNMTLLNIAKKGNKEFYTNVVIQEIGRNLTPDAKAKLVELRDRYRNIDLRKTSEKTPRPDTLGYYEEYGQMLYFAEDKDSAPNTPVKVMKFSETKIADLHSKVIKLNSITIEENGQEVEVPKFLEDPEYGCDVLIQKEALHLKDSSGQAMVTIDFTKGDRSPLTAEQKTWMLWDLTKLRTTETYDEAFKFLDELGYTSVVNLEDNQVSSFEQPKVQKQETTRQESVAIVQAPVIPEQTKQVTTSTQVLITEDDMPF